jgi:hypothetical protein
MGLFDKAFDKIFNVEASLVSTLTTFGQANDAYFKMHDDAMAEAEEKYKDRPANS